MDGERKSKFSAVELMDRRPGVLRFPPLTQPRIQTLRRRASPLFIQGNLCFFLSGKLSRKPQSSRRVCELVPFITLGTEIAVAGGKEGHSLASELIQGCESTTFRSRVSDSLGMRREMLALTLGQEIAGGRTAPETTISHFYISISAQVNKQDVKCK